MYYEHNCTSCGAEKSELQLNLKSKFTQLLKSVEKAFRKLHDNGKYDLNDLVDVKEFNDVIQDTAVIFNTAIYNVELPEHLLKRFKQDVFLFSGLKTHSQLLEASKLLFTKNNVFKSFELFSKDSAKLKKDYNENYLEAEHDYAVGTMQRVERWENFSDSDKYYLQYRTANDDKVRASHALLHNITLPKNSPFWDKYATKNGWRCRCTEVEVLATNNIISKLSEAMKKGEKATTQLGKNGENKLNIFRYNPAKQKIIFPPKHPYHKINGANKVKKILKNEN